MIFGAFNHVGIAGATVFIALCATLVRSSEDAHAVAGPPRARWTLALTWAVAVALSVNAIPELEALAAAGRARSALQQSVESPNEQRWGLVHAAAREAADAAQDAPGEDELSRLARDGELALGREALRRHDFSSAETAFAHAEAHARRAVALEPLRANNCQALEHISIAGAPAAARTASRCESRGMGCAVRLRIRPSPSTRPAGCPDPDRSGPRRAPAQPRRRCTGHRGSAHPAALPGSCDGLLAHGGRPTDAGRTCCGDSVAACGCPRSLAGGPGADERAAKAYLRQLESADSAQ